jgi:hypothetical protein
MIHQLDKVQTFIYLPPYPGVFITLFKKLLLELKHIAEYPKKFKSTLQNYFLTHCIYNLDEFFINK